MGRSRESEVKGEERGVTQTPLVTAECLNACSQDLKEGVLR